MLNELIGPPKETLQLIITRLRHLLIFSEIQKRLRHLFVVGIRHKPTLRKFKNGLLPEGGSFEAFERIADRDELKLQKMKDWDKT